MRQEVRACLLFGLIVWLLAAAAGCGLGPGGDEGGARITVTTDYGHEVELDRRVEHVKESDTVMRLLDGAADIETRYGGGFIQSINGHSGGVVDGRSFDWFFYVNGIEAGRGSADYRVSAGDRIWWDFHDWTTAMRVPAVIGSFPRPLAGGHEGREHPVRLECDGGGTACRIATRRLAEAGVELGGGASGEAIEVLVGPWARVRRTAAGRLIDAGPARSGVFVSFRGAGAGMVGLDSKGEAARRFGAAAGLIAATRTGDRPPVWVITGIGGKGVAAAAGALSPSNLRNRFAAVVFAGRIASLPMP